MLIVVRHRGRACDGAGNGNNGAERQGVAHRGDRRGRSPRAGPRTRARPSFSSVLLTPAGVREPIRTDGAEPRVTTLTACWGTRYKARMMESASILPVSAADIDAAAGVLAPFAVRTPLFSSAALDERVGGRVFLKPEMLQRTGSFKFRGAFNKLSSIPQAARTAGVVAFSSGNHAQGVAAAARLLSIRATIVMPADAPISKRERTKAYGAEVVLYDRDKEDRE